MSVAPTTRPRRNAATATTSLVSLLRRHKGHLSLVAVIAAIVIVTSVNSDVFFTWQNIENILEQVAVVGILACGTTMLMVSGGIDLSIGSNLSFTAMIMGELMAHGTGAILASAVGLAVASFVGLVNGTLAANARTHPFILTLGMLTLLQGAALLISSLPITAISNGFLNAGDAKPLGLPLIVFVFFICAILVALILSLTRFGRSLYAIGGSESAARLSGIRVKAVKMGVYSLSGLLVGVAAILLLMQLTSAQPTMGADLELGAIAAVAVGGTPLAGGRGGMGGTMLGILLIGLIANALDLLSISSNWQSLIQGAVIVIAVMAQRD